MSYSFPYPLDAMCLCGHDFGGHEAREPHACGIQCNCTQFCAQFKSVPAVPAESVTVAQPNPETTPQELFEIAAMYDLSFLDLARICLLQHAHHSARPAADLAKELATFFETSEKTLLDMLRNGPSMTFPLTGGNQKFVEAMFNVVKDYGIVGR